MFVAVAFLVAGVGQQIGSMAVLVAAAVILDASTQANQVFGQRVIQNLDSKARGRLNSAYMTIIFLCGAIGSTLGSLTYFHGGWWLTSLVGAVMALGILLVFLTEYRFARA
jgi:predicted MFS family arabinose efflux permease